MKKPTEENSPRVIIAVAVVFGWLILCSGSLAFVLGSMVIMTDKGEGFVQSLNAFGIVSYGFSSIVSGVVILLLVQIVWAVELLARK